MRAGGGGGMGLEKLVFRVASNIVCKLWTILFRPQYAKIHATGDVECICK